MSNTSHPHPQPKPNTKPSNKPSSKKITILCVSDIIDPLIYSNQIKTRYSNVDIVISSGDLPMQYLGFIASNLNTPLLFVFGNHNLKRYSQFNARKSPHPHLPNSSLPKGHAMNPKNMFLPASFGATYLKGSVKRVHGLLIGGLGGSINYNNGPNQYTETQMWMRILKMTPKLIWNKIVHRRYIDILVAHSPPYGINDKPDRCHRGFKCFLLFMRLFRPRYLLHGHVHLYDINAPREQRYLATKIINVYSHYILNIKKGEL